MPISAPESRSGLVLDPTILTRLGITPQQIDEARRLRERFLAERERDQVARSASAAAGKPIWAPAAGIVVAALPVRDLFKNGVAHIPIPKAIADKLRVGGRLSEWLAAHKNDEKLHSKLGVPVSRDAEGKLSPHPASAMELELAATLEALRAHVVEVMRRELGDPSIDAPNGVGLWKLTGNREQNAWHYDYKIATAQNGHLESAVTPKDRDLAPGTRPAVQATVAVPLDTQGPTVVKPWTAAFKGAPVQGPPEHVTIFLKELIFHRADRRAGDRALVLVGIDVAAP